MDGDHPIEPATHNDEVETVTLYRGTLAGRRHLHDHSEADCDCHLPGGVEEQQPPDHEGKSDSVDSESLTTALNALSKETVWRVKGFVRLTGKGVHILNWAFGRFELTRLEGNPDEEETVRITVMGERGEVKRAIRMFCALIGCEIL